MVLIPPVMIIYNNITENDPIQLFQSFNTIYTVKYLTLPFSYKMFYQQYKLLKIGSSALYENVAPTSFPDSLFHSLLRESWDIIPSRL